MQRVECASSGGEHNVPADVPGSGYEWYARVTAKCPVCGRRTSQMLTGKGKLDDAWPQKIVCRNHHEFEVVPYRWER
jgi:hypothetical protein